MKWRIPGGNSVVKLFYGTGGALASILRGPILVLALVLVKDKFMEGLSTTTAT